MDSKPNFSFARRKANEILLFEENSSFPIHPQNVRVSNKNIIIVSFSKYACDTGSNINLLTKNGIFDDGYTIQNVRENTSIIFYNDKIENKGRIRWTIAHEIGHIVLGHNKQCEINEVEANTFASQLLLPQCILKDLIKNGVCVNSRYISEKFGLSNEAALKSLKQIQAKIENDFDLEYDDIILKKFDHFLDSETKNTNRRIYIDDDKAQELRNSWL